MATTPFDIIAGPADIWIAPTGEAFPDVDNTPAGNWVSLGRTEGGVTVTHDETIELLRVDQATGPVKAIRSEETLTIEFSLAEITLERYAAVLNDITVTSAGGPPAIKTIEPRLGADVSMNALLVRGPSPYMDAPIQYEINQVVQTGSPSPNYVKDDKVVLETEWTVIEDPAAGTAAERFGSIVAQTS